MDILDGVAGPNACLQICESTPGCEWWTYDDRNDGLCVLTEDCVGTTDCQECTVGSVECDEEVVIGASRIKLILKLHANIDSRCFQCRWTAAPCS